MVPSIRRALSGGADDNNLYHASHSRAKDWQACCAMAMGYEDWALVDIAAGDDNDMSATEADNDLTFSSNVQITNLLPSDFFEDDDEDDSVVVDDDDDDEEISQSKQATEQKKQRSYEHAVDPWMEHARNIQADLERMANWIQSKKMDFITFEMGDTEASIIQSTVTSFAATTANEIEALRKMTNQQSTTTTSTTSNTTTNELNHRTGIVQILLARLKEDIVEPFGILQKRRSRKAVNLWQNPLQCKLLVKQKKKSPFKRKRHDELDHALGLVDDDDKYDDDAEQAEMERLRREQRFLPSRDAHNLRNKFMETYHQDEHLINSKMLKRPKSLIRDPMSVLSAQTEMVFDPKNNSSDSKFNSSSSRNQVQQDDSLVGGGHITSYSTGNNIGVFDYQNDMAREQMVEAANHQMQQEALLLETQAHSDLDSVQKMEQQMVSITTLLTQFSEMVLEQQEEVWQIHDTAKETKDNMDKGQSTLVDAAERTQQSKHYQAKGIFAMGCLLLLFHWLRP